VQNKIPADSPTDTTGEMGEKKAVKRRKPMKKKKWRKPLLVEFGNLWEITESRQDNPGKHKGWYKNHPDERGIYIGGS